MLNREEWTILQKQLVSLSDEKNAMIAEIKRLAPIKQQIPIAKQILADKILAKQREEMVLLNEMSSIQQKIAQVRKEMAEMKSDSPQTWDEKRLVKKEGKLKEAIYEGEKIEQQITYCKERIESYKEQNQKMDKELEKAMGQLKYMIECYRKIPNYAQIAMLVQDKESQLDNLKRIRKKQGNKQLKKEKSIHNISVSNNSLQQELDENEQSVTELHGSNEELNKLLHTTTETLGLVKYEYESVKNVLETTLQTKNSHQDELNNLIQPIQQEINEIKQKISENKEKLSEMKQTIEQKTIESDIARQKKKQMVDLLQKMVNDKINDITAKMTNSAYVQKLIAQQEQHWVEREQIAEDYEYISSQHKKFTDTVARKAIIYDELKSYMENLNQSNTPGSMEQFNYVFNMVSRENKTIGKQVTKMEEEKESLEKELIDLKKKL